MLTPIPVKGKGAPRKIWKAPDPQRVLKRQRNEDASSDDGKVGTARRRLKTKRPAAPIELLPAEILERILLISMNFNFLRSSSRIGYRFSTKSFLTGLVVEAFGPTWEVWFGCPVNKICSYRNFRWDSERVGGDPKFQSTVLAFPWVNLSFILEAQQQWYQRHGAGRYFEHSAPPRDPDHVVGGFGHATDVAACFDADWEIWATEYSAGLLSNFQEEPQYIDIHPWTRVPDRLLSGPPDLDKARLLFWLARGGARLFLPQNWELTTRGYDSIMAISDPKLACYVLRLFLRLGVFGHWPQFLIERKLDEAKRRYTDYESFDQLRPVRRLWGVACQVLQLNYHWM